MERDHRRVLLLAPEPAAGLGLDDARLAVVDREAALQRRVDVVRALERAVDGDPAVARRDRDHRVVLDVQLLLVTDPVLALEDEVGGGEGGVRVADGHLVGGELVVRDLGVEDRRERLRADRDGVAGRPERRPVGRGDQRQRLGVVLDLAADRDEDRLVGLDRADDVVARDVGRGHDDDRRPVEGGVEVERDEARVRVGRADRRAEPGAREDQVVGVLGGTGQLGRALAPERGRPARPAGHDRPGLDDDRRRAPRSASSGRARAILHGD